MEIWGVPILVWLREDRGATILIIGMLVAFVLTAFIDHALQYGDEAPPANSGGSNP